VIVVDTNVIAYLTFPGAQTETIFKIHEKEPRWNAPWLWRSEFSNIVSLYLRKGLISYHDSLDAIEYAMNVMRSGEHEISFYKVFDFVKDSKCSSYDCEFLALAQELNTQLLTYDKVILKEFPTLAVRPEDYLTQI
jgi:predicted nucleic acid-binding protein